MGCSGEGKNIQKKIQAKANDQSNHVWVPYAAAGVVFVLHVIAAAFAKNIWIAFGGQILALAVFFVMRGAFPRPTDTACDK